MPVHPTYPGVYVEEIPSGLHTVSGVATSVAAFIGTFKRGPLDHATQILSPADFEREYGGLDPFSEATYGVQQFFLNGGQGAWIVRVADTTDATTPAKAAATSLNGAGIKLFDVTAGRQISGDSVKDPGNWGNSLRLEVDYVTAVDPTTQLFNLTVSEVSVDGDRMSVLRTESYRNLVVDSGKSNSASAVVNAGSRLVYLSPPANSGLPDSSGTISSDLPSPVDLTKFPSDGDILHITIKSNAASPMFADVTVSPKIKIDAANKPLTYAALRPLIETTIRSGAGDHTVPSGLKPLLSNATVDLVGAGTTTNPWQFVVRLGRNSRPFDPTATIDLGGTFALLTGATANPQQIALTGGADGPPPAAGNTFRPVPRAAFVGSPADKTGLYALENVDLFNILCIPEATTLQKGDADATETQALYSEAEVYVESRRAMLIVDIAASVNRLDSMQNWLSINDSLRNPNAVVYFPRTNISDPLNQGRARSIPSSGTIAGLWARTDAQRGVWKAPAGTDARLQNVSSLPYVMTDLENGTLNPLGVNCLRSFPVYSNICWGARTLDGADVLASDWKYVPVRRTTLFLEESLYRGTKWAVFEPNDEPLWAQIRLNVGSFMQDLFRKGAFQGTTPQKAFFVKCDGETTTQQDIDSGIVNIEVGFAPLKPAEFVILKIRQIIPTAAG
jgi:hypothetical protein